MTRASQLVNRVNQIDEADLVSLVRGGVSTAGKVLKAAAGITSIQNAIKNKAKSDFMDTLHPDDYRDRLKKCPPHFVYDTTTRKCFPVVVSDLPKRLQRSAEKSQVARLLPDDHILYTDKCPPGYVKYDLGGRIRCKLTPRARARVRSVSDELGGMKNPKPISNYGDFIADSPSEEYIRSLTRKALASSPAPNSDAYQVRRGSAFIANTDGSTSILHELPSRPQSVETEQAKFSTISRDEWEMKLLAHQSKYPAATPASTKTRRPGHFDDPTGLAPLEYTGRVRMTTEIYNSMTPEEKEAYYQLHTKIGEMRNVPKSRRVLESYSRISSNH